MPDSQPAFEKSIVESVTRLGENLRHSLSKSRALGCLGPYVYAIGETLLEEGIQVDRVNLPAAKYFGFRHPLYAVANLTWLKGPTVEVDYLEHQEDDVPLDQQDEQLRETPYHSLVFGEQQYAPFKLKNISHPSKVLNRLAHDGYVDYLAVALPLPSGRVQPLSIASKTPLPDTIIPYLDTVRPLMASTLDSLYQGAAARSLAQSYLGRITGPKVLAGDFSRGNTQLMNAGILFCDIRGFTSLSQELGASGVVSVVNQIFDVVGNAVKENDGEILKFIGDAVLIVFAGDKAGDHNQMVESMLETVRTAVKGVAALGKRLNLPLAIGFGGHIGDVLYGNIGTEERLDFTVMGPSVNLASRLESLCTKLGTTAVFSENVACQCENKLTKLGEEDLKGIKDAVPVWGLNR